MGCTHSTPRGPRSQSPHTTPSNSHHIANHTAITNRREQQQQQQRPHTPTPPPKHSHFRLHHPSRLLHSLSTLSLSNAAYAAAVFGGSPSGSSPDRPVRVCGDEKGDGKGEERRVEHVASLRSLRSLVRDGKGKVKNKDKEENEDVEKDKEEKDKEREKERVGLPRRSTLPSLVTHRQVSRVDLRRKYKCQERRSTMREREKEEKEKGEKEKEREREREELCIREE
ncbi:hypothetical protein BKA80DRAFT_310573 [Phyllosticta citrichinensis]